MKCDQICYCRFPEDSSDTTDIIEVNCSRLTVCSYIIHKLIKMKIIIRNYNDIQAKLNGNLY